MEPAQSPTSLPLTATTEAPHTTSARHTFVNLHIHDERDTAFTTAEILSNGAVTHKWCVQWEHANTYNVITHSPVPTLLTDWGGTQKLLDTLTSLLGYDTRGCRITAHTEDGFQLPPVLWDSYVNLLPTIRIVVWNAKPQPTEGQSMTLIASINELNMRFEVVLDSNTSMDGLHVAIVSKARKLLPVEPRRQRLSYVRVFCEGVLCFPRGRTSVMTVGRLQTHVLECHPVWMDM